MIFVWLFFVSSIVRAGAAAVVCLSGCTSRGSSVLNACHPLVGAPWNSLCLCPQLAEPACEQHWGAAEEQLGQGAGASCPSAQLHFQGTSMRSL